MRHRSPAAAPRRSRLALLAALAAAATWPRLLDAQACTTTSPYDVANGDGACYAALAGGAVACAADFFYQGQYEGASW
jgi:hypothetical protein